MFGQNGASEWKNAKHLFYCRAFLENNRKIIGPQIRPLGWLLGVLKFQYGHKGTYGTKLYTTIFWPPWTLKGSVLKKFGTTSQGVRKIEIRFLSFMDNAGAKRTVPAKNLQGPFLVGGVQIILRKKNRKPTPGGRSRPKKTSSRLSVNPESTVKKTRQVVSIRELFGIVCSIKKFASACVSICLCLDARWPQIRKLGKESKNVDFFIFLGPNGNTYFFERQYILYETLKSLFYNPCGSRTFACCETTLGVQLLSRILGSMLKLETGYSIPIEK